MIFLNPAILFGLLAAGVPILIHLLNLRQRRRAAFSSLMLLKQIQTSALKRFKIREWLLLAIRSLALFFLAAAFSKPVFPSLQAGGGFATQTKTSALILLDVSPSMAYRDAFGSDQFRQAKAAALRILDYFSENDEIFVLRSNNLQEPLALTPSEAKKIIAQASVESFGYPLQTCLEKSLEWLRNATHLRRELYVVSDFQRAGVLSGDSLKLNAESINVYLIDVSPKRRDNVGITDIEILTKVFEPEKPIRTRVLGLRSGETARETELSLLLDKKVAAQGALRFEGQNVGETALIASPTRAGFIWGEVQLPKDNFELDNVRHFVFRVPEKLRVCLAHSDEREALYVKLALQSFFEGKFFELTLAPESTLDSRNFARFDALVLCGAKTLSSATIQKTVDFVEQGGGLIVFAPVGSSLAAHNELLKRLGCGELKPMSLSAPSPIEVAEVQHPIFEGMFASNRASRAPLFSNEEGIGAVFKTNDYLKSPTESRVLGYQGNKTFLATSRFGNGGVAVFPTVPTQEATNFVLQPLFAPLLFRAIFISSAATQSKNESFIAGEQGSLALPASLSSKDELLVEKPSGKTLVPTVQIRAGESRLFFSPELYDEIGAYRLYKIAGDERLLLAIFAANLSPKESDLEKISPDELKARLVKAGIDDTRLRFVDASEKLDEVSDAISSSRYGLGIWKHLLALVAILLVVESVLGRKTEA